MKKYILLTLTALVLLLGVSHETKAQTAFKYSTFNSAGVITDAEIDTMRITLNQPYSHLTIQPKYVRATGTAAGTMILYYSVNGSDYKAFGDTLSLANSASQTAIWEVVSSARYWRIITSGATTVSATASAKLEATK